MQELKERGLVSHERPNEFLASLEGLETLNLYLLLDPLFHDGAGAALYRLESALEHVPLFHASTLKNMMRVSPWVSALDFSTPMLQWLEETEKPGWGMFLLTPAPLDVLLAHMRSLLLANAYGEKKIFRVWDGRVMHALARHCPEDLAALLGPAHYALLQDDSLEWIGLRNPALEAGKTPESDYAPRACPWFAFEDKHAAAFQEKRLKVIGHNLAEDLYGRGGGLLYKVPPGERPSVYIARQLGRAQSFGLASVEALRLFAVCALLGGEDFYANAPDIFAETGGKPLEDESQALAHMRRLTDGVNYE